MKKEFYTAVTVPGRHLLHSPLTWRLFIPPNLPSQSRESESISSVSSVFYPNCLDPGGGGGITVPTSDLPHS